MAKLPTMARRHSEIENRIHRGLESLRAEQQDATDFVRLSGIGKCQRELWAIRQGIPDERPPGGQALMTFRLGDKVEDAVIEWLGVAGYEVCFPPSGDQWRVEMEGGVGVGHLDGIVEWYGDPRLVEVKSAKARRFDLLLDAGSYTKWSPEYGDQLQAYMGASQATDSVPDLRDSLAIVVCKDDSRLYAEMVRFDPDRYASLLEKARLVMSSSEIVSQDARANGRHSKFCKWCSRADWCYSALAGIDFDL